MSQFNPTSLDKLKACRDEIYKNFDDCILENLWTGRSAVNWLSKLKPDWKLPGLTDTRINRNNLLKHIQSIKGRNSLTNKDIHSLIVNIFAWGGMRQTGKAGYAALQTIQSYDDICEDLIYGLDAVTAYRKFFEAKEAKRMRGIGPAFYTKLIFFLGDQTGLIMDQWTARSVNLLSTQEIIKLKSKTVVSDCNCDDVYKRYLEFVAELQRELGIKTLSKTEELLFSSSSKTNPPGKKITRDERKILSGWRAYVCENT